MSKYDIIVSNPPYIPIEDYNELEPEVNMFEPDFALTDRTRDGLTFYSRFADIFKDLLKHDGSFYLEIGYGQRRFIHEIFSKTGFKTEFSEDYQGIPRVVAGKLNN